MDSYNLQVTSLQNDYAFSQMSKMSIMNQSKHQASTRVSSPTLQTTSNKLPKRLFSANKAKNPQLDGGYD